MYLSRKCDEMVTLLKADTALQDCCIIKAFPYAKKPTRLQKIIIAVTPAALEGRATALGEDRYIGEYGISVCLYIPQSFGSPVAFHTAETVVNAVTALSPVGIKLGSMESRERLDCFLLECTFTFCGEIRFEEA